VLFVACCVVEDVFGDMGLLYDIYGPIMEHLIFEKMPIVASLFGLPSDLTKSNVPKWVRRPE